MMVLSVSPRALSFAMTWADLRIHESDAGKVRLDRLLPELVCQCLMFFLVTPQSSTWNVLLIFLPALYQRHRLWFVGSEV